MEREELETILDNKFTKKEYGLIFWSQEWYDNYIKNYKDKSFLSKLMWQKEEKDIELLLTK